MRTLVASACERKMAPMIRREEPIRNMKLILVPMALAFVASGCRKQAPQVARASLTGVPAARNGQPALDAGYPPIECPLAKLGGKHAHLRPFEDVEKYIAFLDRPERAVWQRPDAVVAALGLKGSETLVDIGAGSGYFAFRFANALPQGKVVAVDVEPEMVRHMHHKAMTEGIRNVHVVLGKVDDPEVPPDANLVFVCDVLHHVADRAIWLGKLASRLGRGARLVVIEFKEGPLPEGPPESAKIPKAELVRQVTAAGFQLEREQPNLLPYQHFLVFRRP
jgi:SAM-dependent methyltransferase